MFSLSPFSYLPKSIRIILILNLVVFGLALLSSATDSGLLNFILNLLPYSKRAVLEGFQFWRLITYMFTHFDVMHFVFNMLMLWMFGDEVAATMGDKKFTWFYLGAGVFSAACSFMYDSMIGASGALYAVMFAYAYFFPNRQILMFFIIPMPIKFAIYIFAIIELLYVNSGGNIARWTHLGGFLAGFLYFKFLWPTLMHSTHTRSWMKAKKEIQPTIEFVAKKANENADTFFEDDVKLDRILLKISRYGAENLEPDEKAYLEAYSKRQQIRKGNVIDLEEWKKRK